MTDAVLTINAGSSSIKFALFERDDPVRPQAALRGELDGIGAQPRLKARDAQGAVLAELTFAELAGLPADEQHRRSLDFLVRWLDEHDNAWRIIAVGHRVVHGADRYAAPVALSPADVDALAGFVPLAPLHQPHNLAGIEAAAARFPGIPQVACFDTAFHRTHAWEADTYALPPAYYARGVRRYGFHGLSYEYITQTLAAEDPLLVQGRLVVAHLGNGASLCAIAGGRSVDSTMGFTALDGVPMGTRSGQIDPGVLLYLLDQEGMSTSNLTRLLYGNSGLRGMSGLSQDVRVLEASDRPEAAQALAYFAFRVRREIGALAAVLGGIDALVFTAGIGENARALRARICEGLEFLGIRIDPARNQANGPELSPDGSAVRVLMRRTDEEGMIAQHVLALLAGAG